MYKSLTFDNALLSRRGSATTSSQPPVETGASPIKTLPTSVAGSARRYHDISEARRRLVDPGAVQVYITRDPFDKPATIANMQSYYRDGSSRSLRVSRWLKIV